MNRIFILLCFLIVSCTPDAEKKQKDFFKKEVGPLGLEIKLDPDVYSMKTNEVINGKNRSFGKLVFVNMKDEFHKLKIEIKDPIEKDQAGKFFQMKLNILQNLYTTRASPYRGSVTTQVICPEELRPKIKQHNNGDLAVYLVSDRGHLGQCDLKLKKFGMTFLFYHELGKKSYEISYLLKAESFESAEKKAKDFLTKIKFI